MEEATRLRTERTQAKTKVTMAGKKLIGAISRKSDEKCVDKFMFELEEAMADFEIIHEEYCDLIEGNDELQEFRTVNNLNLEDYAKGVKEVYCNAVASFRDRTVSQKQSVKASPLLIRLQCCKERLSALCEKTHAVVFEDHLNSRETFEALSRQFNPLIAEAHDLLSQLGDLVSKEEMGRISSGVYEVLSKSDALQMDCLINVSKQVQIDNSLRTKKFVSDPLLNATHPQAQLGGPSTFSNGKDSVSFTSSEMPRIESDSKLNSLSLHTEDRSDIQIKKVKLPEFSGQRRDWPEFRAIWRELAERAISSKSALAYELKRSLKGQAKERVKNVFVTKPEAYDIMWERLCDYYDDVSAGVDTALEGLRKLKSVKEDDYRGIVHLVDEVEAAYAQLEELQQVDAISTRDVDNICELLPSSTRMVWIRAYHEFRPEDKVKPLKKFLKFLANERASVARLAENQKGKKSYSSDANATAHGKVPQPQNGKSCVIHKGENVKHKTEDCRDFKSLSLDDKFKALRETHVCFRCFGPHRRDHCRSKVRCDVCSKFNHHTLLCKQIETSPESEVIPKVPVSSSSHVVKAPSSVSLYAIQRAFILNGAKYATVFCDNGANTSYITHRAADRLKAKKLDRYTLDITTMGNVSREYDTRLYEVSVRTDSGEIVPVLAFGIEQITGPVSTLDSSCLSGLFPSRDVSMLQRKSTSVEILLGCDYYGLHPKREVCRNGNLSIMQGELGLCLVGSHPDLKELTEVSCNMVKFMHDSRLKFDCNFVLRKQLFQPDLSQVDLVKRCDVNHLTGRKLADGIHTFVQGEELATSATPKCGSCRCGKCPSVGHTYSFKEEQELNLIQNNLRYVESEKCWYTSYPWLVDPGQLPDNYHVALATLKNTERTLSKDPEWACKYNEQMQDMLQRQVARELSPDEVESWEGPYFYISHLAVSNPKSQSTPVRIVFNSSQKCDGVSLNGVLAKGPDCYMNNLLGLLLRWREENVAVVGDIRKMFHSVKLETLEQHCHRFIWRELDASRKPSVYVMLRVNMGDTPAPAICTEALYKTAEKFGDECPRAAGMIASSTYVDDIVDSFCDRELANDVVKNVEEILDKGGFHIKCWVFSGESTVESQLKGTTEVTKVLGVNWNTERDQIVFEAVLNFSPKRRGERTGLNLKKEEIPHGVPTVLTRRIVLEQVMLIFDPLGLLSPFTFIAKLYLSET